MKQDRMVSRVYVISGRWNSGVPEYSLWEILPEPKHSSITYHPDQRWREIKLPEERMKRGDIEKMLYEKHPKSEGWNLTRIPFREDDELYLTFHKKEENEDAARGVQPEP